MGPIRPGPRDPSVLRLQSSHRSESVWRGVPDKKLSCREHLLSLGERWEVDERVLKYVTMAGFYGVHRVSGGGALIDRGLITALLERWRRETHTFHPTVGEATITLQDVQVLFGLRVHGHAVTGHANRQWDDMVEELLGIKPESDKDGNTPVVKGSTINITWLKRHFKEVPEEADDHMIQCHSRAYILMLIGTVLFPNKSGSFISLLYLPLLRNLEVAGTYSWGSATLAYLYRQLCRACEKGKTELAGPLLLMQLWSWEHILIGKPEISKVRQPRPDEEENNDDTHIFGSQHQRKIDPLGCTWLRVYLSGEHICKGLTYYRDALDHQHDKQMIWQPYSEEILQQLPEICISDPLIWRTKAPLIHFDIVELYYPDRVLRQFGFEQPIPDICDTNDKLHHIDGRSSSKDFERLHSTYIAEWNNREKNIASGIPFTAESLPTYMGWYRKITRLLIIPPSVQRPTSHYQPATNDHILVNALADVVSRCSRALASSIELPDDKALPFALETIRSLESTCTQTLSDIGQGHLVEQFASGSATSTSTSRSIPTPRPKMPTRTNRRDGRGFKAPRDSGQSPGSSAQQTPSQLTPLVHSPSHSTDPSTDPSQQNTPSPAPMLTPGDVFDSQNLNTPTSAPLLELATSSPISSPPGPHIVYQRKSLVRKPSLTPIAEVHEPHVGSSTPPKKKQCVE